MPTSKRNQIAIIKEFIDWVWDSEQSDLMSDLIARYAVEVLTECDTAIAHGPGHQSTAPCIVTGPHSEHYSSRGQGWSDANIGRQVTYLTDYSGPGNSKVTKTYRLAFDAFD